MTQQREGESTELAKAGFMKKIMTIVCLMAVAAVGARGAESARCEARVGRP